MTNRTSPDYVMTVATADDTGLVNYRNAIAVMNANSDSKYRVDVKPRLGKDNPNAGFYKNKRSYHTIRMEHGSHFDVYVRPVYPATRTERFEFND